MADEVAGRGRRLAGIGGVFDEGAHAAAARMAHDDDMLDLQVSHREFERRRCAVQIVVRRIGRNKIGDVADDEDFAGIGIEDHFRRDARIAAADQKHLRLLPRRGEFAVAILFAPETAAEKHLIAGNEPGRQQALVDVIREIFNSSGHRGSQGSRLKWIEIEDHVYLVFDAAGSRPSLLSAPTLLPFARHEREPIERPYRPIGEAEGSDASNAGSHRARARDRASIRARGLPPLSGIDSALKKSFLRLMAAAIARRAFFSQRSDPPKGTRSIAARNDFTLSANPRRSPIINHLRSNSRESLRVEAFVAGDSFALQKTSRPHSRTCMPSGEARGAAPCTFTCDAEDDFGRAKLWRTR